MSTLSPSGPAASKHRRVSRAALFVGAVLMTLGTLVPGVQANSVLNGGFETPLVPTGGFTRFVGGQTMGAWTVVGPGVLLLHTQYAEPANGIAAFTAHAGMNSLDLTGLGNEGPSSGVVQTVPTTAGQIYDLSFFVGRASSASPLYSAPATVDLSINGGPRVAYTNTAVTAGTVHWTKFTKSFVATGTSTTLAFYNGTPSPITEAGLDSVVLTLGGPWSDLGAPLAGLLGDPSLTGSGPLTAGSPTTLSVTNARPLSSSWLVIGVTHLGLPFKGGTLVPNPDLVLGGIPINGAGAVTLGFTWPAGVPGGVATYYQFWIVDAVGPQGFSSTNGLAAVTP